MTLIDGLRGIAAMIVVLPHAEQVLTIASRPTDSVLPPLTHAMQMGGFGVDIFFVISGYVIAFANGRAAIDVSYAGRFALRRSVRLDPTYWSSILIALFVVGVTHMFANRPLQWPDLPTILANLVYLQYILGYPSLNGVHWTLCLEVQFYLLFILLLVAIHRIAKLKRCEPHVLAAYVMLAMLGAALVWSCLINPVEPRFYNPWFPQEWYKFLLGVAVYHMNAGLVGRSWVVAAIAATVLTATVHSLMVYSDAARQGLANAVAILTAILLGIAGWRGALYRWLNYRPLLFAGAISYSLYLVHVPVIQIFIGVQARVRGEVSTVEGLLTLAAAYACCLAAAWLLYRLVERPSLRFASRIGRSSIRPVEQLAGGIEGPASDLKRRRHERATRQPKTMS